MRNDEPDAVDRVLDEALSRYSSEEPLAGLEQRVLNRVRAEGARRRRGLWPWMLAAGAVVVAASVAFVAVIWTGPVPDPARVVEPVPQATPRMVTAQPLKKRMTPRGLPKRRQFPTPAPVTSEERVLLALAERAPKEAREAFFDLQERSTKPIRLEEIKIEPLESDGLR